MRRQGAPCNQRMEIDSPQTTREGGRGKAAPKAPSPMKKPLRPCPQRLKKKNEGGKFQTFISMLKQLSINLPLIDALEQMPDYAKFMKDLVTKKRTVSREFANDIHHCSTIATRSLVQKKEDPRAFTIHCTIGVFNFAKALCDLGASINLMPLAVYKQLGLESATSSKMWLLMADRIVKKPVGILYDILVISYFPADFVILDCKLDFDVPITLGDHS